MTATAFDPARYKETTREQWQDAAEAWNRWEPTFDEWLGPATERMLDLAGVGEGSRVLDVAAGSGGQTYVAARRGATVLATDLSEAILGYIRGPNIATRVMDGENLDVENGTFDAAISRLGIMYFPDKARALAEQRRVLRPGGRVGAIVFAEGDRNGFFSVPISIIRGRAGLPAPSPGLPGPFSAVGIGELLESAGFTDVAVERLAAPLRLPSAADCARLERESFGALHQMLADLEEADRAAVWAEIEGALGQFEGPEGFVGPCELLVAAGTA
jgi:SAM-dependent methyltransferase